MHVAIVGSGRSGTSLTARLLNLCGLSLGRDERLSMSNTDNLKGFWELVPLNHLNERLLKHLGGSHGCPPFLEPGWHTDPGLDEFYAQARKLLDEQFSGEQCWGWKDPRTTFLLPFWKELVPDLKLIVCVRNPLAFVSSAKLYGRDLSESLKHDNAAALSHELDRNVTYWHLACLTALSGVSADDRIIVNYEDYFPDYRLALSPIIDFLGLSLPAKGSETDIACQEFCDTQLMHHQSSIDELIASTHVNSLVKTIYASLRRGVVNEPAQSQLDAGQSLLMPLLDTITYYECEHLEDILLSRTHRIFESMSHLTAVGGLLPRSRPASSKNLQDGGSERTTRLIQTTGMPVSSIFLKLAGFLSEDVSVESTMS